LGKFTDSASPPSIIISLVCISQKAHHAHPFGGKILKFKKKENEVKFEFDKKKLG
jgi:hypothetical protein